MEPVLDHRYKLLRSLGQGGMGQVWLALDDLDGREVAVKVLTEQLATDRSSVLQVKQEFRLMTLLQHPNCCEVYNYGILAEGQPYFTMEVVPGEGLDALLPASPERFRPLLVQLLQALAYVHQRGYVHGDIKSENVRVRPDGTLKLMDFGLMLNAGATGLPIRGTLGYVAPEIIQRGPIDRRSDLYAVGCLAFEVLTGALPFRKKKPVELLQAHLGEQPPLPRRLLDEEGRDWTPILAKLLAKDPTARYQSAEDVLEGLGVAIDQGAEAMLLAAQLVGREPELARLQALLERVARGEAGEAIALQAPPGLGKSRLMAEVRIQAQLAHLPFGAGTCHRQLAAPLAPVAAALRALLPALREVLPALLAELAPVLVGILLDLGVAPAPELDSPDKEKARLFDAMSRLFVALAREKGLVLAFDDWQWADSPSREFLAYLLRNTVNEPLGLVVGQREATEGLTALPLAGLSDAAVEALIGSVLGTDAVPAAFVAQLVAVCQGNPQLVLGGLDHLVRHRLVRREGRQWAFSLEWDAASLPANRLALLLQHLEATSDEARLLARTAALLAAPAGLDVLLAVSQLEEDALFVAIAALLEQQLLQRTPEGEYELADEALATHLDEAASPAERRAMHLRGLDHLEGVQADATRLARHALGAEDDARAIRYALEAGRRSTALFAYEEARVLLEPGLAKVRAAAAPELLAYVHALADVYRIAARYDDALGLYAEGIALAADQPLELARLLTSRAKLHMVCDRLDEAVADVERALAGRPTPGPEALRAQLTLARALLYRGRTQDAMRHADEALASARGLALNSFIAQALSLRGYLELGTPQPDVPQGVQLLQEACARFAELGDRQGLYNAANLLGDALMGMGSYEEAWQAFEGTRQLAYELGLKDDEAMAWLNLAITALERGRLGEARDDAARTIELASALQRKFTLGLAQAVRATARILLGEPAGGEQALEEALALARTIKSRYMELLVRQFQAEALTYLGAFDEALEAVAACKALEDRPSARTAAYEGAVLVALRRHAEARPVLEAGLARAIAARSQGDEARIRATLARLDAATERYDESEKQAAAALVLAEHIGAARIAADLHGLRGEMALGLGRPAGGHFETMEKLARASAAPVALALALFGRAAASPYEPAAKQLVAEAGAGLERAMTGLGPGERERFLRYPERWRVTEGNHIAFSLPRPARRRTPHRPLRPWYAWLIALVNLKV